MFLTDIWNSTAAFYGTYQPYIRIIASIGIIVLVWAFKRFIVKELIALLHKLTAKTRSDFDDQLLDVIGAPLRFALMVLAIALALKIFPFPLAAAVKVEPFIDEVTRSLVLFALFWVGYRAADVLTVFIRHVTEKSGNNMDDMFFSFINSSIKALVFIIGGITIIQVWVANIAGILTGLGLGGLAFALAAQETAANLFGSVTIMLDKPFGIGDLISTPQVEGTVEKIGFRSTRVRTAGQALVTIPNSTMSKEAVTNWSRMEKRLINFRLGVAHNTTDEQMEACVRRLREMLKTHPGIDQETILVYFERFGENSLDIFLYFFTKTAVWAEFLAVQEDVNLKIMQILEDLKIEVAFPARAVYLEKKE